MDEQTQQMIQMLAQVYMQQTGEQDPNNAMQVIVQAIQAAQQGDQQAQQMLQSLVEIAKQGAQQPAQIARHGAKLSYIKRLRGICPEGEELVMFKKGGRVCKKCVEKKETGSELNPSGNKFDPYKNKNLSQQGAPTSKPTSFQNLQQNSPAPASKPTGFQRSPKNTQAQTGFQRLPMETQQIKNKIPKPTGTKPLPYNNAPSPESMNKNKSLQNNDRKYLKNGGKETKKSPVKEFKNKRCKK